MANSFGKAKKGRGKSSSVNNHRTSVASQIDMVVQNADIILEVLDARFIDKTRQPEIEEKIKELGKKVICVLNKADLANVKKIHEDIELGELSPWVLFSARERKGTLTLRNLIKKEAKKLKKDYVNVGIIGYPNTGKSSLTNVLSGKSSAKVSSESGYTKSLQKIKLSKGIYLIDTPGIILDDENPFYSANAVKHSEIGAVGWNKTKNPEMAAEKIFAENRDALMKHYGIDSQDPEDFFEKLGRKMNFLRKGNMIDEEKTARKVLRDWQEGKIKP